MLYLIMFSYALIVLLSIVVTISLICTHREDLEKVKKLLDRETLSKYSDRLLHYITCDMTFKVDTSCRYSYKENKEKLYSLLNAYDELEYKSAIKFIPFTCFIEKGKNGLYQLSTDSPTLFWFKLIVTFLFTHLINVANFMVSLTLSNSTDRTERGSFLKKKSESTTTKITELYK